jgi:hypothetical protein
MKTKKLRFTSVAIILFFFTLPALAGKPGNVPEVIVVSTIDGTGVLADPTVPNYRLQSDLLGDYRHGVDQVVSHLQGGQFGSGAGDWEIETAASTVRKLTLDLREPYDSSANPPFAPSSLPARIIVKCHLASPASIGGMRGLNSTLVCLMNVSFVLGRDVDPSVTDSTGARNLARLVMSGKGGRLEDRGRYYMRFHISFRK